MLTVSKKRKLDNRDQSHEMLVDCRLFRKAKIQKGSRYVCQFQRL